MWHIQSGGISETTESPLFPSAFSLSRGAGERFMLAGRAVPRQFQLSSSHVLSFYCSAPVFSQPYLNTAVTQHGAILEQPVSPPPSYGTGAASLQKVQNTSLREPCSMSWGLLSQALVEQRCGIQLQPETINTFELVSPFYFSTMCVLQWKLSDVLLKSNLASDFGMSI